MIMSFLFACASAIGQEGETPSSPISVGDQERNFSLTDTNGDTVSLESFKDKSVVLILTGNPYT